MKKIAGYTIVIVVLSIAFTLCYYISFKNALNQFNKNAVAHDSRLLAYFMEYNEMNQLIKETTDNDISVSKKEETKITAATKYVLQTYKINTNELTTQELHPTSDLIGMTRNQVISMLSDYMTNLPVAEKNKGLFSYELLSFSPKQVIIRKSYNEDLVEFRYYVAAKQGKVIIYYSDRKTVYEHTNIDVVSLREKDRNELMTGIMVKDEEELYALLESFSS